MDDRREVLRTAAAVFIIELGFMSWPDQNPRLDFEAVLPPRLLALVVQAIKATLLRMSYEGSELRVQGRRDLRREPLVLTLLMLQA